MDFTEQYNIGYTIEKYSIRYIIVSRTMQFAIIEGCTNLQKNKNADQIIILYNTIFCNNSNYFFSLAPLAVVATFRMC